MEDHRKTCSPYLREAAKRADIIGSKWDHDEKMLRFQRQQALYQPLERSKPVWPPLEDWLAGALLFATICGIIWFSLVV